MALLLEPSVKFSRRLFGSCTQLHEQLKAENIEMGRKEDEILSKIEGLIDVAIDIGGETALKTLAEKLNASARVWNEAFFCEQKLMMLRILAYLLFISDFFAVTFSFFYPDLIILSLSYMSIFLITSFLYISNNYAADMLHYPAYTQVPHQK